MSHQIAKLLLEKAGTFLERAEAVKASLDLGMPLGEIEEYLDWLEMLKGGSRKSNKSRKPPGGDVRDVG